jgi:RNA polymerase sigma-70 factor, ECF subfamily
MSTNVAELEAHRVVLTGHCYRMLGSAVDADDAVQETMVRAWKSIERFDGRASLRTWLHRIATNVCLDALADRKRRFRPIEEGPAGTIDDQLESQPRTHWLEPIPDAKVIPGDANPAERAMLRQSIRLAFVAALQHLPPKQRAVLLLSEVLGWSAQEIAETIEGSVASVNSALQRARATLGGRNLHEPEPLAASQEAIVQKYVVAFERYDIDALTALLTADAKFSMPPYSLWLEGPAPVAGWLLGRGSVCRGSKLIPIAAAGSPAFGQYHPTPDGGFSPWSVIVLELEGEAISGWTNFLDAETLFPRFGLPSRL